MLTNPQAFPHIHQTQQTRRNLQSIPTWPLGLDHDKVYRRCGLTFVRSKRPQTNRHLQGSGRGPGGFKTRLPMPLPKPMSWVNTLAIVCQQQANSERALSDSGGAIDTTTHTTNHKHTLRPILFFSSQSFPHNHCFSKRAFVNPFEQSPIISRVNIFTRFLPSKHG